MKTDVRQTSIETYHDIVPSITGKQCQLILSVVMLRRDATLSEIAQETGLRTSSISGRANELKRAGALEEAPRRQCSVTGRSCIPVRITPMQMSLIA